MDMDGAVDLTQDDDEVPAEAAVVAVDGALAAGGDRGALPAKVVLDVGRVDEGGARALVRGFVDLQTKGDLGGQPHAFFFLGWVFTTGRAKHCATQKRTWCLPGPRSHSHQGRGRPRSSCLAAAVVDEVAPVATTKAGLVVKFVKAEVRVVGVVAVRWSVHKRPCRVLLPRELEGALCGSGDC